jgi:hypothetical protein
MPLVQTRGAASAQGFGEFAQATVANYIEDVFSTFLYTGTGATQTIINNIDLSGKGGLTWSKDRSAARTNSLIDTVRGATFEITSDDAGQQTTESNGLNQFNSNGYRIGPANNVNASGENFVSWTFREQAKFFDVLTYTGTGVNRTIAHNLGSVPGCIMVKRTTTYGYDWAVYHRSLANTEYLVLNSTAAKATGATWWNSTTPTSTVFSVGTDASVNASGATYVAYLFAHDAGGFGLTGTDNVISCGSFTTDGSGNATVSLGYEPQLFMRKNIASGQWTVFDNMRAMPATVNTASYLFWSNAAAESANENGPLPTAVGVSLTGFAASETYIYIAIRRGPMKVPTLGTSVYKGTTYSGTGSIATISGVGFSPDMVMTKPRSPDYGYYGTDYDRLRGVNQRLSMNTTAAENTVSGVSAFNMDGYSLGIDGNLNSSAVIYVSWSFRRAPGFFDEVCYTGTGAAGLTVAHNLTVVPELMIVKGRSIAEEWNVYFGNNTNYLKLNRTDVPQTSTTRWNDTSPTSSVFSLGTSNWVNGSGSTYVAYLFATCAGVSKVFSYTGNGSSQTINCGFTGGSRFVMIKRTDSTGDWYVWDSARGIVAGNDPHLSLNSTAAEVTTDDSVDTDNTGFIVNQVAATNVNVSSATYIGLAIA